ncbi:protein of unknown function [uncultured Woeseiaceae bacterium]|uniref:Uncharacterized protein n=1 Tax=uncultured Woeseiaceae bacterium TaxID=1983305 RepID=A0A7D9H4H4_9GAMM|nr:protein of unknown function [uncultured Woeseiaceae bacterium]
MMRLDDILYEIETARLGSDPEWCKNPFRQAFVATRSSVNYAVALFGEPASGEWGWKLTGHHYAGWMPLPHKASRGVDLMLSMNPEPLLSHKKHVRSPEDNNYQDAQVI